MVVNMNFVVCKCMIYVIMNYCDLCDYDFMNQHTFSENKYLWLVYNIYYDDHKTAFEITLNVHPTIVLLNVYGRNITSLILIMRKLAKQTLQ